ncbi:hypothetical protein TSUD_176840 [Trifolium subterraneum]|uniref:Uncharacterized protein n=1 Tax=Trifolium subterraneum TaxID=3900 RepID=A0A2Z6LV55_TRISU|nr:hypothetical protein TSUD_176840 [Trifolium subterraneum]
MPLGTSLNQGDSRDGAMTTTSKDDPTRMIPTSQTPLDLPLPHIVAETEIDALMATLIHAINRQSSRIIQDQNLISS